MGKSWNIPGFDVYDPSLVLYAPLWRPDMVARGGAIKNGTGALSVSPIALAVGANTITVSTAGTFIANMPAGGTVASGTMTVTGSPVTVSAGIATTITTTGAIGTITCTPSNIIRSKDRNNYALTRTGGVWGSQGITMDGDDSISLSSSLLDFTTGNFSFMVWFQIDSLAANRHLLGNGTWNTNGYVLRVLTNGAVNFATFQAGANQQNGSYADDIITGKKYCAGVSRSGTAVTIYYNGVARTPTLAAITDPVTAGNTFYVGRTADATNLTIGTVGEVWGWNRAVTAGEQLRAYQETKWRYIS